MKSPVKFTDETPLTGVSALFDDLEEMAREARTGGMVLDAQAAIRALRTARAAAAARQPLSPHASADESEGSEPSPR